MPGEPANHGITWAKGSQKSTCLRPGDTLALTRQHVKKDVKVEIKIWFKMLPADEPWGDGKVGEEGAPIVITLGKLEDNRFAGSDSTITTDKGSKPLTEAGTRPGKLALQFVIMNGAQALLKNDVWFACPVTPHDKRCGVLIRIFVGGAEEKPRTLELLTRQMNWGQKLEAFLEWQDKLVYAPPKYVKFLNGGLYSKRHWDGGRILHVSSTGKYESCYVCSPLGNAFMAYWCNYHDRINKGPADAAGQSRDKLVAEYKSFLEGGAPLAHGAPAVEEAIAVAALNAIAPADRAGRFFRLTDAGDLVQGLPTPKKKASPPKPLTVAEKALVSWNPKKLKWSSQKRLPVADDWTFRELYEHLSKAKAGSVYLCGTTTHVWMMVVMGDAPYTTLKKPMLGGGGNCEPGVYRIQAAAAVPLEYGYTQYLKPEYVTANKITMAGRQKPLKNLEDSLEGIKNRKALASDETAVPYATIYENLSAAVKKIKGSAEYDGMWAFGGTDLTMCNAQLSQAENKSIVFNRGEAAPSEFRKKTANSETFKVWQVKHDLFDDETGWLKADHPDVPGDTKLSSVANNDCRPIDSE